MQPSSYAMLILIISTLIWVVASHPFVAPPGISFTAPNLKAIQSWSVSNTRFAPHRGTSIQKIHGLRGKTNGRSVAAILGAHQRQVGGGHGYENITTTNAYGTQFAIELEWSGRPLYLLLDTGSSDTWAIQKDFECIDFTGESIPQTACAFGPTYQSGFDHGETSPAQHMFIRYGDGEIVMGPMGYSDITVGNITVTKQQVCLANSTYWYGNNVTSGLLGLAFPSLTNSYIGSQFDHERGSQIEYSPLFTSMVSQGKVAPLFSITIDRNSTSGTLALGGIPPVVGLDKGRDVTLDMIIVSVNQHFFLSFLSSLIHSVAVSNSIGIYFSIGMLILSVPIYTDQLDQSSRNSLRVFVLHNHSGWLGF